MISEEEWLAITHNDASYDDKFLYAVKTTGIFCKPSCRSRVPVKQNVQIFHDVKEAISANFRPCKRCEPTGRLPHGQELAAQISQYITTHYMESISLESLAGKFHSSPYHLHRTFKRYTGMTPVGHLQLNRMNKAKELLATSELAVADIAKAIGMSNVPYFITLFKKRTGQSPTEFRQANDNESRRGEKDSGNRF